MADKNKCRTMRIDLIPEISTVPLSSKPQKISSEASGHFSVHSPAPITASKGLVDFRALFDSIYDAGLITDIHGRIRDANSRAVEFFGWTGEELADMCIWDVVSGADAPLVRTIFDSLNAGQRFTVIQAYCLRKDGSSFPAEIAVSGMKSASQQLNFLIRDITLRKQTDEMLRTEHNAIQNASEAIVVTGRDGYLEYVNPATLHLWKYASADQILGKHLRILMARPDDADILLSSLTGETFQWNGEALAVNAEGTHFRIKINAVCNRDSDGYAVGAVLSFLDASSIDREEKMIAELSRTKDALATIRDESGKLAALLSGIAAGTKDEEIKARIKQSVNDTATILRIADAAVRED